MNASMLQLQTIDPLNGSSPTYALSHCIISFHLFIYITADTRYLTSNNKNNDEWCRMKDTQRTRSLVY